MVLKRKKLKKISSFAHLTLLVMATSVVAVATAEYVWNGSDWVWNEEENKAVKGSGDFGSIGATVRSPREDEEENEEGSGGGRHVNNDKRRTLPTVVPNKGTTTRISLRMGTTTETSAPNVTHKATNNARQCPSGLSYCARTDNCQYELEPCDGSCNKDRRLCPGVNLCILMTVDCAGTKDDKEVKEEVEVSKAGIAWLAVAMALFSVMLLVLLVVFWLTRKRVAASDNASVAEKTYVSMTERVGHAGKNVQGRGGGERKW